MMAFLDTLPTDLLANAPSSLAAIIMAALFLRRDAEKDRARAEDRKEDAERRVEDRTEDAERRTVERQEFLAAMASMTKDVSDSNARVERAMTDLLAAKSEETAALTKLAERLEGRGCPALQPVRGDR